MRGSEVNVCVLPHLHIQAVADIIRTTLGPRAMLKMLLGALVDGSSCRLG